MVKVLSRHMQTAPGRGAPSIFRCPECGSFFDAPRENPETGGLARKCLSCEDWYPVVGARRRQPVGHLRLTER